MSHDKPTRAGPNILSADVKESQAMQVTANDPEALAWLRGLYRKAPKPLLGMSITPTYLDLNAKEIEEFKRYCPLAAHMSNITTVKLINPDVNVKNADNEPIKEHWLMEIERLTKKGEEIDLGCDEGWDDEAFLECLDEENDLNRRKVWYKYDPVNDTVDRSQFTYENPDGPGVEILYHDKNHDFVRPTKRNFYYGRARRDARSGPGWHQDPVCTTPNPSGHPSEFCYDDGTFILVSWKHEGYDQPYNMGDDVASTLIYPQERSIYAPQIWSMMPFKDGHTATHSNPAGFVPAGRMLFGFLCPGAHFEKKELMTTLKAHYHLRPDLMLNTETVRPNSRGEISVKPFSHGKKLAAVELHNDGWTWPFAVTEADRKKGPLVLKKQSKPATAYYGDIDMGWLPSWMGGKPVLAKAFVDLNNAAVSQ